MPSLTMPMGTTTMAQAVWPRPAARPLVRDGLLVVGFSLLTALAAQVSIPLPWTPVPLTMQTFAVLLTGALLGPRLGALSLLAYLAEGAAGLPVFEPHSPLHGLARFAGPSGGYLLSYPFAAGLVGWLALRNWDKKPLPMLAAMAAGSLVIYAGGATWLAHFLGLHKALLLGVAPFVAGDAVKALAAAALLPAGWKALGRRG